MLQSNSAEGKFQQSIVSNLSNDGHMMCAIERSGLRDHRV